MSEGTPGWAIRPMTADDVHVVTAVERRAFSRPWRRETFRRLVEETAVVVRVAEEAGEVVGYGVLIAAADQGEIANLAVDPQHRNRGLGRGLLDELLSAARAAGVARVFLEVRVSNDAARHLYASRGFEAVGRRPDYYREPREDALVLALDLTTNTDEGAIP